jgi:hypothetical protein
MLRFYTESGFCGGRPTICPSPQTEQPERYFDFSEIYAQKFELGLYTGIRRCYTFLYVAG